MTRSSPSPAWQVYLFATCLICVVLGGGAATVALTGAVRVHYPKLLLDRQSWSELMSFNDYRAARPALADVAQDEARTLWQAHRQLIIKRERYLGYRRLFQGSIALAVAAIIFLPHLWWIRRLPGPAT